MKIAVEGCAHGELNKIYECLHHIEQRENIKIDLLICCGDFQSVRDRVDMNSMAVPEKYLEMKDFWEYYTGKKTAPVLTIFIGGNHEASSYLWELPYGGWVAENIYYLGYAGVVSFAGIRIGGMSGIYKRHDYLKDHFEVPPFDHGTKRSFYHVRKRDVEKLKLLKSRPPHIMLSHDWPTHIYNHGNVEQLMRFKPFLREDIENEELGNVGAEEVLHTVQPPYWFSGHMHAKFAALVQHPNGLTTKFLALDKCLPKRKFLQVLDMGESTGEGVLKYDSYWLGILKNTNELSRFTEFSNEHLPSNEVLEQLEDKKLDVLPFSKSINGQNVQTAEFCERFGVRNPCMRTTWKSIKETSKCEEDKSKAPTVPTTPRMKMVLPEPGTGDTIVRKKTNDTKNTDNKKNTSLNTSCCDDEFGELTNPSSLSLQDLSEDDSSNDDDESGSSGSSNSDNDENSSEDGTMDGDDDTKCDDRDDTPSFIETPMPNKSASLTKSAMQLPPASTPLRRLNEDERKEKKELMFTDSPQTRNNTDISLQTDQQKVLGKNINTTSDYGSDGSSVRDATTGGETDQGDSEPTHTPVKKFKLVRRNQNIYTPTKEDD